MAHLVECRSDFTYPQRPMALHWEGQRLRVDAILGMWLVPAGRRFLVRTTDRQIFELIYDQRQDHWQICLANTPGKYAWQVSPPEMRKLDEP